MKRPSWRSVAWVVMAAALPLFSQSAKATPVDFLAFLVAQATLL